MDPASLAPGTLVLACTKYGLWMRARVESAGAHRVRVQFVDESEPRWLPRLSGILDREHDEIPPERIAIVPRDAPRALPALGTGVIALWDRKRFHKGTLVAVSATHGIVRFDEGDELAFDPSEILPCGAPIEREVDALRARGLHVGAAVVTVDDHGQRGEGWISELGSGRAYVRWSGVSWGLWASPERLTLGGPGRRAEKEGGPAPGPGARARVRWLDREIYDAVVLAVDGARVRVRYDDGTEQSVERSRVVVVGPVPDSIAQARAKRKLAPFVLSTAAVAQGPGGSEWLPVTVLATRGVQVYVAPERGKPFWTWGNQIAGPLPEPFAFPAEGTAVVAAIEQARRGKRGPQPRETVLRPGHVGAALGDRVTVSFREGEQASVTLAQLWQRGEKLGGRASFDLGARVDVEREPDAWEEASVEGAGEGELVKVRFVRDRRSASVDRSRMRARPVVAPPPPPPPEPTPTPLPPPPAEEPRTSLLRAIASRWTSGGYRGDPLASVRIDESAIALPVERGTLIVRATEDAIEITADLGASEALPPADAPLVRLAGWIRRWTGGPAGDDRADRERAWALELCGSQLADVERAGGALTLRLWSEDADDVVRIARAAHARIVPE